MQGSETGVRCGFLGQDRIEVAECREYPGVEIGGVNGHRGNPVLCSSLEENAGFDREEELFGY